MNEPKTYTAKDIERYHRGDMSAAERHFLEKAALDDPMLADALEGYSFAITPAADLQALQNKLQERIGKEKKSNIFSIGNNWLKIAALFIVIVGSGWLVIQFFSNKNENAAMVRNNTEANRSVNNNAVATDSAAVALQNNQQNTTSDSSPIVDQLSVAKNNSSHPKNPSLSPIIATSPAVTDTSNVTAFNIEKSSASRRLALSPGNSAPPSDEAKEERVDNTATAMKMENKNAPSNYVKADTVRDFSTAMKKSDERLQEVAVSKAKATRKINEKPIDNLEPAQGWEKFDDYVAKNRKMPDELKDKTTKGEVELSFAVDEEGHPINIIVTKPLCEKCDEEAIRLLKEGPKWIGKKKNGTVKIKFSFDP